MVLLILESLGSTELVFILVMALVFFGPRKLPQISRSLGKNLAEFRRASEDFKRTWDREVNLEDVVANSGSLPAQNAIPDSETTPGTLAPPKIAAVAPDQVIARHTIDAAPLHASGQMDSVSTTNDSEAVADAPPHSPKNDWI
ncbi:MAG TPA: twin-arginine translocase TatA/TatE family subunit [Pyrinomonadaceae bacterium]|nr:twin-arginine translocase TatA/TatE family subunit [Pyrinomonadaceae bacterium]